MVAVSFKDELGLAAFFSLGILLTADSKIIPTVGEACLIVAICFGWFMLASIDAVVRGFPTAASFSDSSLSGLMAVECFFGAIALAVLHLRGYSIKELLPKPTWRGCLAGTLLCAVALCACWLVEQLFSQSQREAQPILAILENARPTLVFILALSLLNGLYEETFLLGYLIRGFSAAGASFALGLNVLVRLLYHLYQGPMGAVSVVIFGLVVGYYYWRTRVLWPAVFAHMLADVLGLAHL